MELRSNQTKPCICFSGTGPIEDYEKLEQKILEENVVQTKITTCDGKMKIELVSNGDVAKNILKEQKDKIDEERKIRDQIEEEREKKEFQEKIAKMKKEFEHNPLLRFEHIKKIGSKWNFQTTYVIELRYTIKNSNFTPAYPGILPETKEHTTEGRYFYVGATKYTAEERFHTANYTHMGKTTGAVYKHRMICDSSPYSESVSNLNKLTKEFGFENPREGNPSQQFEHYVAWALYLCGHYTWGPKFADLSIFEKGREWLGEEYPFI